MARHRNSSQSKQSQSFDPNSPDAMFAKIIARLDQQDTTVSDRHEENSRVLGEILTQTKATNGRVTKLEQKWREALAWIAGASFVLMLLWALFVYLTRGH